MDKCLGTGALSSCSEDVITIIMAGGTVGCMIERQSTQKQVEKNQSRNVPKILSNFILPFSDYDLSCSMVVVAVSSKFYCIKIISKSKS